MIVLSLFDGISCGRLALERAGIKVDKYYACEIDKFAIEQTKRNFPDTIHVGDIRDLNPDDFKDVDIIIGGSPCQSFTFAGKRNGMSTVDEVEVVTYEHYEKLKEEGVEFVGGSYLFWEYIRLLRAIKPKYFLLENVKMENYWRDVISRNVGVEPILINSNLVSAQNRRRYYWTNIRGVEQPEDKGLVLGDIIEPDVHDYYLSEKRHKAFLKSYKWTHNPLDQKSKTLLATYYKQPPHCPYIECESSPSGYRCLTPTECERLQTMPDGYTSGLSKTQRYKTIGKGWTIDVISHIFGNLPMEYKVNKNE